VFPLLLVGLYRKARKSTTPTLIVLAIASFAFAVVEATIVDRPARITLLSIAVLSFWSDLFWPYSRKDVRRGKWSSLMRCSLRV